MNDIGAYNQVNRIIEAAIPGPSFAPGVTKDGGMFSRFSDWQEIEEPQFPSADEPKDQQPRSQLELMPPNIMAQTLWVDNVPEMYPFRKYEFDEGVTYVRNGKKGLDIPLMDSIDDTFPTVLIAIVVIALIIMFRR
jgi:hypothetical protein